MGKCIYCKKNEADSFEHIIQNCLGSNIKSKDILCSECNNLFGRTIDLSLSKFFEFSRNKFMVKGKRNIPALKLFDETTQEKVVWNPGQDLKLEKVTSKETNTQNEKIITLRGDLDNILNIINDINKSRKILKTNGYTENHTDNHTYTYEVCVNIDDIIVSQYKTFINISYIYLKESITSQLYSHAQDVKNYCKKDVDIKYDSVILERKNFGDNIYRKFFGDIVPPNHKFILSFNRDDKSIIGVCVLFGCIKFSFLLAEDYTGNNAVLAINIDLKNQKTDKKILDISPIKKTDLIHEDNSSNIRRINTEFTLLTELALILQSDMQTEYLLGIDMFNKIKNRDKIFIYNFIDSKIKNITKLALENYCQDTTTIDFLLTYFIKSYKNRYKNNITNYDYLLILYNLFKFLDKMKEINFTPRIIL